MAVRRTYQAVLTRSDSIDRVRQVARQIESVKGRVKIELTTTMGVVTVILELPDPYTPEIHCQGCHSSRCEVVAGLARGMHNLSLTTSGLTSGPAAGHTGVKSHAASAARHLRARLRHCPRERLGGRQPSGNYRPLERVEEREVV